MIALFLPSWNKKKHSDVHSQEQICERKSLEKDTSGLFQL